MGVHACAYRYRLDMASGANALIGVRNASLMTLAKCLGSSFHRQGVGGLRWGLRVRP